MELELVETSELVDELLRRFDHVVFAAMKPRDGTRYVHMHQYKGNAFACAGLAARIQQIALNDWSEKADKAEPGDV